MESIISVKDIDENYRIKTAVVSGMNFVYEINPDLFKKRSDLKNIYISIDSFSNNYNILLNNYSIFKFGTEIFKFRDIRETGGRLILKLSIFNKDFPYIQFENTGRWGIYMIEENWDANIQLCIGICMIFPYNINIFNIGGTSRKIFPVIRYTYPILGKAFRRHGSSTRSVFGIGVKVTSTDRIL